MSENDSKWQTLAREKKCQKKIKERRKTLNKKEGTAMLTYYSYALKTLQC